MAFFVLITFILAELYTQFDYPMRLILIAFITSLLLSCQSQSSSSSKTVEEKQPEESQDSLTVRKATIDNLRMTKYLVGKVYAKVPHVESPIEVLNLEWPNEIEEVYNIWLDTNKSIVCIGSYPYSPTGDWDLGLTHYFKPNGKTFAFEKLTSFYNSRCTEGLAIEQNLIYYNNDFHAIDSLYVLTDAKANPLEKDSCTFPYTFDYSVYGSHEKLLKVLKISL